MHQSTPVAVTVTATLTAALTHGATKVTLSRNISEIFLAKNTNAGLEHHYQIGITYEL